MSFWRIVLVKKLPQISIAVFVLCECGQTWRNREYYTKMLVFGPWVPVVMFIVPLANH